MQLTNLRLATLCLALIVVCTSLSAQTTGSISVTVRDQETGNPLVGANVTVVGTALGAATNSDGVALIKKVPSGAQTVRISIIGLKTVENPVTVEPGRTASLDVTLEPTELDFESVVVTATRGASLVSDVSAPVEVLSAAKIDRTNAQTLGEVLSRSTGVYIKDYGAQGGLQTISIRGSSTSQVLVLVDGQRVSPANGSGIDFGRFAPETVEKIEIVRGGNSALYGADATGGIINIITKSGKYSDNPTGSGKVTIGSFSNRVYAATLGQQVGRFHYYGAFNRTEIESFKYLDDLGAEQTLENTQYESNEGFLKLGLQVAEGFDIIFRGSLHDGEKGTNSLVFPSPLANLKSDRQDFGLSSNSRIGLRLLNKVQVYRNRLQTEFVNPGGFSPEPSITEDVITGVEVDQRAILTTENALTYGYNYRHEKADGNVIVDVTRTQHAGFAQLESEWKLSDRGLFHKVMIIPAARFDDYSDFGSSLNPKIGVVLSRTGERKFGVRANFGTSFRAPGFFDLNWPDQGFFKGNPDLQPEESTDFDVGIVGTSPELGGIEYEVTYYRSSLDNEIQTAPDATGVFTPQNLGSSKRKGFETRLALSPVPKTLRLEANYTYNKATDETEGSANFGNNLIYRPENVFNMTARVTVGVFDLNVIFSYVDKRYSNAANTASIGPYSYLEGNVGFRYKRGNLEYFARVQSSNLGDRAVDIIAGFPQPKRTVGTTFGINF